MRSASSAPTTSSPSCPGLQPELVSCCSSSFHALFLLVILFIVSALSLGSEGILLNGLCGTGDCRTINTCCLFFFSVTGRSLPAAFSCYSPNVSSGRFLPSQ